MKYAITKTKCKVYFCEQEPLESVLSDVGMIVRNYLKLPVQIADV